MLLLVMVCLLFVKVKIHVAGQRTGWMMMMTASLLRGVRAP
jgi:hypothetical protein